MQLTDQKFKYQKGFTLIEMAIVLVIIGIVVAAGMSVYQQYKIEKDWDKTTENLEAVVLEIKTFYETYGRYPCPASATAAPGDAEYGIEKANCIPNPVGSCADGVCTVASANAPQEIMIGSLPFKKLNLQDRSTYDAYLSRFTYAVTSSLTDTETFNPQNGGISVGDGNTPHNSLVQPPNTAHFVVISHGRDKSGSTARAGVQSTPCVGVDSENCDGDELFTSREIDSDFDDLLLFHTQYSPTEWRSTEDNTAIDLKTKEKMLINATSADDALEADDADVIVRKQMWDNDDEEGNIVVDNKVFTEQLCDDDTNMDNCFNPRRIAGKLIPEDPSDPDTLYHEDGAGNGMSCYEPGNGKKFLRGIKDGGPDCTEEVTLECPDGEFITSVVNGRIRCTGIIQDCPEQNVNTFCGDSRTLPLSPPTTVIKEYSGECQYIDDYDSSYFATATSGLTAEDAKTLVLDPINSAPRDVQACESGNSSQVRDSYVCNDGTWEHPHAHEKRYTWYNFPSNIRAGGTWKAENSYSGSDPNNNNHYHDCWCREDYRIQKQYCPDGSLDAYRVQKHNCPQTAHNWTTIYTNTEGCSCSPTTKIETMSCNAYYNSEVGLPNPNNGLEGTVYLTYDVTCSGNTPVQAAEPTTVDASDCQCKSGTTIEERTPCSPSHYTNSWTNQDGGYEEDVAQIKRTPWTCPGTNSISSHGETISDPAFRDNANATIEPATDTCDCVGGTKTVALPCGGGLNGQIYYDAPIDCVTGDPVSDQSLWTETSRDCRECRWETNSSFSMKSAGLGVFKGGTCDCGSDPEEFCSQGPIGNNKYKVWTGCQCIEQ